MSILIKGMEIPTGDSYIFALRPDGMVEDVMGCYVGKAVHVPPHGRLIDADAEVARVQNLYNKAVAKDPEMGCVNVYEGEIAVLKLAPTIIPASGGKEDE